MMNVKELRKMGFSQRKPVKPGVYFVAVVRGKDIIPISEYCPARLKLGWDLASVYYKNDGYPDSYDNRRADGIWYMETMSGSNHAWRKGTWLKGPIDPSMPLSSEKTPSEEV